MVFVCVEVVGFFSRSLRLPDLLLEVFFAERLRDFFVKKKVLVNFF